MNVKKPISLELKEFFILGFIVFTGLYLLIADKINVPTGSLNLMQNRVFTQQPLQQKLLPVSDTPEMSVINDNNTRYNLKDDVVIYNTSYYSITLPYDLAYFTDQFGANESSKQLLLAHKQLYDQVLQNELLKKSSQKNHFDRMLESLNRLVNIEDDVYGYISKHNKKDKLKSSTYINSKLKNIESRNTGLMWKISNRQNNLLNALKTNNLPASNEAVIIISTINDHLFILADRTTADYYTRVMNKSYYYSGFNKPVIYNIVDRIDKQIQEL